MLGAYLAAEPEPDAAVAVSAYVHRRSIHGWTLHLHIDAHGPAQRHEVHGSSCAELAAVTVALMAAALEPSVFARPPPEQTAAIEVRREDVPPGQEAQPSPSVHEQAEVELGPARTDPIDVEVLIAPDEPEPSSASRRRLDALAGVTGGAGIGLFPNVHAHVQAEAGIEWGWLQASVLGLGAFGGRVEFDTLPGARATIQAWALGMNLCAVPGRERWAVRACVRAAGGAHRAVSFGVEQPQRVSRPWLLVSPTFGFEFELRPNVTLLLELGAGFNLLRPLFKIDDLEGAELDRHATPVVFGFAVLGFQFVIPTARATDG